MIQYVITCNYLGFLWFYWFFFVMLVYPLPEQLCFLSVPAQICLFLYTVIQWLCDGAVRCLSPGAVVTRQEQVVGCVVNSSQCPLCINLLCWLFSRIVPQTDVDWVQVYDFVFDRLRAVRQDAVIQGLDGTVAITLFEHIVCFHVYAGYRYESFVIHSGYCFFWWFWFNI